MALSCELSWMAFGRAAGALRMEPFHNYHCGRMMKRSQKVDPTSSSQQKYTPRKQKKKESKEGASLWEECFSAQVSNTGFIPRSHFLISHHMWILPTPCIFLLGQSASRLPLKKYGWENAFQAQSTQSVGHLPVLTSSSGASSAFTCVCVHGCPASWVDMHKPGTTTSDNVTYTYSQTWQTANFIAR